MIYKRDFPLGAAKIGRLFYKSKFWKNKYNFLIKTWHDFFEKMKPNQPITVL
jgi:hypothetical protein